MDFFLAQIGCALKQFVVRLAAEAIAERTASTASDETDEHGGYRSRCGEPDDGRRSEDATIRGIRQGRVLGIE